MACDGIRELIDGDQARLPVDEIVPHRDELPEREAFCKIAPRARRTREAEATPVDQVAVVHGHDMTVHPVQQHRAPG